jgi:hypothetical protein
MWRAAYYSAIVIVAAGSAGCGGPRPLVWHEENGYRWAELAVPRSGHDGFEMLPPSETGVTFQNSITEAEEMENENLFNGSGVALGDVDGDGLTDIYFASLDGPNALYRNMGNWRFEDITERAGVSLPNRFVVGVVFADVDGDGDLDLLTTSLGGGSAFFVNDGSGVFEEKTEEAGLASSYYGTTQALADVDGDGDLDLYVADNKERLARDIYPLSLLTFEHVVDQVDGEFTIKPEFRDHYRIVAQPGRIGRFEYAEPDKFYLNDGKGRFVEQEFTSGQFLDVNGKPLTETPTDWGLTARFHDFDGDGDPDLYVCNDFESPDRFWINDGTGRFRMIDPLAVRVTSNATMTMDVSDINRDGYDDIMLLDMLGRTAKHRKTQIQSMLPEAVMLGSITDRPQVGRNTLLLNRGDNTFTEIARFAGVEASDWTWSATFLDVDLDGYEDLLLGNGHLFDFLDSDALSRFGRPGTDTTNWRQWRFGFPKLDVPSVAFRNNGDLTFDEMGAEWGWARKDDVSQGAATADLDHDGDLDVVVNRLGFSAALYRNESSRKRIAVRLLGRAPNTQGIGSKIRVRNGPVPEQHKEVIAGGKYLSGSDPEYMFAVGESEAVTIIVDWRSGLKSVVRGARPNRVYEIDEAGAIDAAEVGDSLSSRLRITPPAEMFFRDVSTMLNHTHVETDYNDFLRQPLLRHRLSQLGPGITWYDFDRDGDQDLFVTSGKGGRLALFRNDDGELSSVRVQMAPAALDQTMAVAIPDPSGAPSILVGQANYEAVDPDAALSAESVLRVSLNQVDGSIVTLVTEAVSGAASSTGPLAIADYDGDGDLDLFVGGRVLPARYPVAATSRLFLNDGGSLKFDEGNSAALSDIGMVSSALFSDIDLDGDPDLLLAMDWGPIRILTNENGQFSDASEAYGTTQFLSMWNGITVGDFNSDGRLDIVATSWGRNTRLAASADHPMRVYYGDFDANGVLDIIEARYDPRIRDLSPLRGWIDVRDAIPFLRRRITSFAQYADASVPDLLDRTISRASQLDVNTFDHMLFMNRGGHLEATPLPTEAQLSPSFYAGVADYDGDGNEDLFLSQNFFPTEPLTLRYAAGRGLWLRGDGTGRLDPVSGSVTGVKVYGDQRSAALADYDRDGRVDLVVSQNGNATKLYHNELAKPGLRVRLVGPRENPDAVGSLIRVIYGDDKGPVREVHAGSGYLSQDGMVQVMGLRGEPTGVWVRWPNGRESTTPVGRGIKELVIHMPAG